MNKSSLLVKITYILVSTSQFDHSNIDGPPLAVKCVRKFGSAFGGEVLCVCVCVCVCARARPPFGRIFQKFSFSNLRKFGRKISIEVICEGDAGRDAIEVQIFKFGSGANRGADLRDGSPCAIDLK